MVKLFEAKVRRVGYQRIASAPNARQALDPFGGFKPDLVLADMHMGSVDGLDLFAPINEEIPARPFLPIVVVTGDASDEARLQALLLGATDFLTNRTALTETMLRLRSRLKTRIRCLDLERGVDELRRAVARAQAQKHPSAEYRPPHR